MKKCQINIKKMSINLVIEIDFKNFELAHHVKRAKEGQL